MVQYGGAHFGAGDYGATGTYGGGSGYAAFSGSAHGGSDRPRPITPGTFTALQPKGMALLQGGLAQKKRLNVCAVFLNMFVPWLIFCLFGAMLSFEFHYTKPEACQTFIIITIVVMVLLAALDVLYMMWQRHRGETALATATWLFFLCVTSLVALGMAVAFGNRNFWLNSQVFFDVTALNVYNNIDPARMRGQELMDAGRVRFVNGTHLDLKKSMGFKNVETYCVAPIAGGAVVGDPPLASYDFWAVGKDCCSGNKADFQCGDFNDPQAHSGVRLVRDDDRAFYRLAVQQAESAYNIKTTHPLFFHWVRDPVDATNSYKQDAFKTYMVGMFAYFGFQGFLVFLATAVFSQFA